MLIQIGATLLAWLILGFISTNLIGLLVRGFFSNPAIDELTADGSEVSKFLAQEHEKQERTTNVIAVALIAAFLFGIYYFWNIGLVAAAIILMVARIPDLVWEIRNGRKLQSSDMARPKFHLISTVLFWVAPLVIWYALYRM